MSDEPAIGEEELSEDGVDRWIWDPKFDAALDADGVVVLVAQGQPWSGLLYKQLTHEHNLACLARKLIPGLIAQHWDTLEPEERRICMEMEREVAGSSSV